MNPGDEECLVTGSLSFALKRKNAFSTLFEKWQEATMSIAEILPGVRALSRGEEFQLAQLLLADLAREELPELFREGQVYPIYTPEYAPGAAAQLAQVLREEGTHS
jgi:hypothetical protein